MTKPHGPAYKLRRRCPFCGMIVNSPKRFRWIHKHQTWLVVFGGRKPGGEGVIVYEAIPDEDYDKIMLAQLKRLAKVYGFVLRKAES